MVTSDMDSATVTSQKVETITECGKSWIECLGLITRESFIFSRLAGFHRENAIPVILTMQRRRLRLFCWGILAGPGTGLDNRVPFRMWSSCRESCHCGQRRADDQ